MNVDGSIPKLITECVEQGACLQDVERAFITLALERYGRVESAAHAIGLSPRVLYRRIRQYKVFHEIPEAKKDTSRSVGFRLREARIKRGMSVKELAYKLGYRSPTDIYLIETGRRSIPKKQLRRLAKLLGLNPEEL